MMRPVEETLQPMKSQPEQRCPHYQLHSELLAQEGPPAYLAIRHCLLAARMLHLMQPVPETEPLAQRLTVQTQQRAFACVGPDLDAVTQHLCTLNRCDRQCTPAYRELLQQFNIVDPQEDEVTCDDTGNHEETRQRQAVQPEATGCTC